jgi:hypothetical protein
VQTKGWSKMEFGINGNMSVSEKVQSIWRTHQCKINSYKWKLKNWEQIQQFIGKQLGYLLEIIVFWDVMLCSQTERYSCFEENCCLHFQGEQ